MERGNAFGSPGTLYNRGTLSRVHRRQRADDREGQRVVRRLRGRREVLLDFARRVQSAAGRELGRQVPRRAVLAPMQRQFDEPALCRMTSSALARQQQPVAVDELEGREVLEWTSALRRTRLSSCRTPPISASSVFHRS